MDDQAAVMQYRMAAEPAFQGYIETTLDALLIFEACQRGICPRVTRRLHERERRQIGSGSVYVFDEREAGIKRWTDGRVWSPSRILQNFLVYRELDKRAAPPNQGQEAGIAAFEEGSGQHHATPSGMPGSANSPHDGRPRSTSDIPGAPDGLSLDRNRERALVGSLTSSYRFRADGLVKKTISVSGLHMISYYKIEDVLQGRLRTPSSHPELHALEISPGFLVNQNFRVTPQIEIGPDGRPRYRGEGEEGMPGSSGPPGPLHPPPPPGSAMAYAYVPGPSDRPSRPSSDGSGNSHAGSPASPHLAIGGPSGPGSGMPDAGPSRQVYGRGQPPVAPPGSGRPAMGMTPQGGRYEPYGRPNPQLPQSPNPPYYPPSGSGGVPPPTHASFGGYAMGDQIAAAMSGQRGPPPPSSGWAGRHPHGNGAPYYGPSPPNSATDGRSFESMQQSLPGYPPYRVGASATQYAYPDEQSQPYRSTSVPPSDPPSDATAAPEAKSTAAAILPESRPSSATYHQLRLSDEPGPSYMTSSVPPPSRGYLTSSRRQSSNATGVGPGPTRTQYETTGGPLRGASPYQYVAPGGGSGPSAAMPHVFRPASASSNSAYSSIQDSSRGAGGTSAHPSSGRGGGVSASSGSPLLSPSEGHPTLPTNLMTTSMMGPLAPGQSRHKDPIILMRPPHPMGSLAGPQGSAGSSSMQAGLGDGDNEGSHARKSTTSWQTLGSAWPPFKQEE